MTRAARLLTQVQRLAETDPDAAPHAQPCEHHRQGWGCGLRRRRPFHLHCLGAQALGRTPAPTAPIRKLNGIMCHPGPLPAPSCAMVAALLLGEGGCAPQFWVG